MEGLDDTGFRVYRESNPAATKRTWWSVAGSIDELKALAEKLETKDGGPKATKLSHKMLSAVPRFEAGEEVSDFGSLSHLSQGPRRWTAHMIMLFILTMTVETQTQRISPDAQRTVQASGAWFFHVRGPHSRKEDEVHLFG